MKDYKELEEIRKLIDVGGPTMCHSARKVFLSTSSLITSPSDYKEVINELIDYGGRVSLKLRLELTKKFSSVITSYMVSVDETMNNIELEDLFKAYEIME
ncbi:hypothetical protein COL68_25585 [Bacillus wiedmannii]|uniref:hypothetical protein n=1 Tax=Bacillus wiedmannii TaxID=1890302 RepID=UPI000BF8593F|nr:hypothetical protein [Bacillus wiedmannii]PFZ52800.1 hypothetical protein COL68_25585 [Bacillus wiedmannii]